jgi:transposase
VTRSKNEVMIARAQRMYRLGFTIKAIAEAIGVANDTAHMWVDPAYREKRMGQIRAARTIKPKKPTSISKPEYDPKPVVVDPRDEVEIMRRAIELRMRGYRAQAIAALLRVPYRKVEEALR